MRRLIAFGLLLLPCVSYASKPKDAEWQTGTLREISTEEQSSLHGHTRDGHGSISTRTDVITHYFIDAPGYTYEATRVVYPSGRQLVVTVHGSIKFALKGHDFFIQDDEGKTQKLAFVMREAK